MLILNTYQGHESHTLEMNTNGLTRILETGQMDGGYSPPLFLHLLVFLNLMEQFGGGRPEVKT